MYAHWLNQRLTFKPFSKIRDMQEKGAKVILQGNLSTETDVRGYYAFMDQSIAETHTGNHHRNLHVAVPTAPGQPTRG